MSSNINFDKHFSGSDNTNGHVGGSDCCAYGDSGTDETGYDCALIPGALQTNNGAAFAHNAFCGMQFVSCKRRALFVFIVRNLSHECRHQFWSNLLHP